MRPRRLEIPARRCRGHRNRGDEKNSAACLKTVRLTGAGAAACNVTHVIESRLARWLLRAADLRGSDELPLTQEYIAQMLGVRRTSVTVVARTLQEAGMIRYKRGHINLIDVPALQETACECYHTVKMNYDALLHPSNR